MAPFIFIHPYSVRPRKHHKDKTMKHLNCNLGNVHTHTWRTLSVLGDTEIRYVTPFYVIVSNSIHICLVFCLWHGSWIFACINFFVCWLKDYTKTTRDFHEAWMEDGS